MINPLNNVTDVLKASSRGFIVSILLATWNIACEP